MIFITGDTHGLHDGHKLFLLNDNFKDRKLTRSDYVIVAGDFGFIWNSQSSKELKYLSELDLTILFVDGNHENFDLLEKYPIEKWNGGNVHKISDNIIHLMRGQVFTIEGKTFFTFGGAESIDRQYRVENVSWWKREIPSQEEFNEAVKNLNAINNDVDFIITHDINTRVLTHRESPLSKFRYKPNPINDMLEYFEQYVNYKTWFFGHYHEDMFITEKKIALYNNVLRIVGD